MSVALTRFAARAGDHNDRAMAATPTLTARLEQRFGVHATVIGEPAPALATNWDVELTAAMPALREMATRYDQILTAGGTPVTALSRCAVALATLPVVARRRPDAVVVWFDAHADLNTPADSATGYLGGLAFSGPLGLWDSGLGEGLTFGNAVLVGARDLDPAEQRLIESGSVANVPVGVDMADRLGDVIDGRPVYVHIDCDVLDPGIVPTDYRVPAGMTLAQLRQCAAVLARGEVVGIEIGELEAEPPFDDNGPATRILDALEPLLQRV